MPKRDRDRWQSIALLVRGCGKPKQTVGGDLEIRLQFE